MKSFTEEEVINFSNRRFSSPSICEYQTSKGDSGPRKKPEPKPIIGLKMDLSDFQKDRNQENGHGIMNFTVVPDFEIRNPTFGNHFTCLMFVHVLDDYPKSLDQVFDDLRLEKPFDYFFPRFDVVSLVVLKVQGIKNQFQMEASRGRRHNTCVLGTWNWLYLRKTSKMDLRTNHFKEGEYDTP
ncbi:hypothetical protein YC2023_071563 [Brassica napus]